MKRYILLAILILGMTGCDAFVRRPISMRNAVIQKNGGPEIYAVEGSADKFIGRQPDNSIHYYVVLSRSDPSMNDVQDTIIFASNLLPERR